MTSLPTETSVSSSSDDPASGWPTILASFIFSLSTYAMLCLYGLVHGKIMLDGGMPRKPEIKEVYPLLTALGRLRIVFAILALIWAVWSLKGRPRWAGVVALAFAAFAVCTIFVMM